jgi:hypothetical protein
MMMMWIIRQRDVSVGGCAMNWPYAMIRDAVAAVMSVH